MNITLRVTVVGIAAVFLSQPGRASLPSDSCLALIPAPVQEALAKQLPEYRLPVQSDNFPEDVAYSREHGGSGCLGLAAGYYHGSHTNDYALLVTSRSSDDTLLVVASLAQGVWRVERLRNWAKGRSRLYVESVSKVGYRGAARLDFMCNLAVGAFFLFFRHPTSVEARDPDVRFGTFLGALIGGIGVLLLLVSRYR